MNTMVSPSCKEGEKVFDTFLAISSAEYFIHIIFVVADPSSSIEYTFWRLQIRTVKLLHTMKL